MEAAELKVQLEPVGPLPRRDAGKLDLQSVASWRGSVRA
jgi:hypothetical protein